MRWLVSILLVVCLAAVGGGAYLLGRHQGEAGEDRASAAAQVADPSESVTPEEIEVDKGLAYLQVGQRNVKALLVDGSTTWLGTSGGLIEFHLDTGEHRVHDNRSGLLSNGVFYVGKPDRRIWVGTYGGGLSILDPQSGTWQNYNIPNGMGDAFVYDVLQSQSGDIWIATWSGVNRIVGGKLDDDQSWELYTVENTQGGLPNDWVYGLAEGKNGEIWLATEGGLARYRDENWAHWNHADGLGAAFETVEDDIEFQSDPARVSDHHARQKQEQGLEDIQVAYNPNYIVSLAVDLEGRVWAGTWGGGLSQFDGETWRTLTVKDGLPANHVFALEIDGQGRVWVGTSRGLAWLFDNRIETFGHGDGLLSHAVFSIGFGDGSGAWAGGFGGATWLPAGVEAIADAQ